ncbi:MAG: glycosyltransferase family 39 protein [Planctomycetes bacterium]|nr:glycosyltransferase family 39 protein [Planctomycetota bacterium]
MAESTDPDAAPTPVAAPAPAATLGLHAPALPGAALLLALLALPLFLVGLGSYPIRDAESKYAEVPREILESGDWLTLRLDYTRYLSKPPLSFWLTALSYRAFGVTEFAARAPNAAAGVLVGLALGAIAATLLGRRAGVIATLLWLTTGEVYLYTRDAGIEMVLLLWMTLSVLGFLRGPLVRHRGWTWVMWAAVAAGVLTKGPIALFFPAVTLAAWCRLAGCRPARADLRLGFGAALLAATIGPYLAMMAWAHDDYLWYVFVHEQWFRLLGTRLPNDALSPTGLWLGQIAIEFFPWIFAVPHALVRAAAATRGAAGTAAREGRAIALLGLAWALPPLLVFALAKSKVDFYGLHVYPGILLLVTWLWEEAWRAAERPAAADSAAARAPEGPRPGALALPWVACAVGAVAASALFLALPSPAAAELDLPPPPIVWTFLAHALVGFWLAGAAAGRGCPGPALAGITVTAIGFGIVWGWIFAHQETDQSLRFAAVAFRAEAPPGARLVATERPEFAHVAVLPFYAHRRAYLLRDPEPSQLHFTLRDPEQVVIDEHQLVQWVAEGIPVYLVADRVDLGARLGRLILHGNERAASGRRSLYRLERAQ